VLRIAPSQEASSPTIDLELEAGSETGCGDRGLGGTVEANTEECATGTSVMSAQSQTGDSSCPPWLLKVPTMPHPLTNSEDEEKDLLTFFGHFCGFPGAPGGGVHPHAGPFPGPGVGVPLVLYPERDPALRGAAGADGRHGCRHHLRERPPGETPASTLLLGTDRLGYGSAL